MACVLDYVELRISSHSGRGKKIVSHPRELQRLEKAWLTIRETVRTNHLPQEEENAVMTLAVKAIRENHPRDGKHYVEVTQIINKLVANKVHHEIDTFFAGLFHQLMANNVLYRSVLEKGLMFASAHPEKVKPEAEKFKGPG